MKSSTISLLIAAAFSGVVCGSQAKAGLVTGDIAFVGFNADGDDGFAIAVLTDIAAAAAESIYFRDDEWDGSGFGSGENEFRWNIDVDVAAGTVVTFVTDAGGIATASVGTTAAEGSFAGDMGISQDGETIFAYQGATNSPATFLAAISTATAGIQDTLAGTGLTAGTTAVTLGGDIDVAEYDFERSMQVSFADYLPLIGDTANWNIVVGGSGDQSGALLPFNTTSFETLHTPEPASLGMMGLGAVAFGVTNFRRRRRRSTHSDGQKETPTELITGQNA